MQECSNLYFIYFFEELRRCTSKLHFLLYCFYMTDKWANYKFSTLHYLYNPSFSIASDSK